MLTGSIVFPLSAARNLKAAVTAVLLFASCCVYAQEDTLQTKTFNQKDITAFDPVKEKVVSGANRITENPDELAVRTYIITRDEIIRNGYISLNDVLRTLPGFRISEPSNAYIGESFLMRGLTGNMYTKILINGIAITPSAAPGFPLGSNLPIRQAERIEIILGPASTIYGSDAMAGVINIVIPEVERPVEALAGVSAGTKGRNEFNLFLGGKAGSAKNVLQYQLFGSSVSVPDRNLNLNDDLIRVDTNLIKQVGSFANYKRSQDTSGVIPLIAPLPHESRLIGASLKFKDFRFMALQMYRKDHSALGSHPEVVGYHNPNTFISDTITSYQLQYDKTISRLWIHTNINANNYRVNNSSSYIGITHPLANGRNFFYAWSRDVFVEQLVGYRLNKLSFLAGANVNKRRGIGYQSYLKSPYDPKDPNQVFLRPGPGNSSIWVVDNSDDPSSRIAPGSEYNRYTFWDYSGFLQGTYKTDRLNINMGIRMDRVSRADSLNVQTTNYQLQTSPRAGLFYKVNKMINVRVMYAQAFRMPGGFYLFNNYENKVQNADTFYIRIRPDMKPENMQNIEGGIVFTPMRGLKLELHYFSHHLRNSITLSQVSPEDSTNVPGAKIGYNSFTSSTSELQAFELFVHYENKFFTANLAGQYNIGKEQIDGIDTVRFYRSVPDYQLHAAVLSNIKAFRISLFANYFSDFNGALIKLNNQIDTLATTGYLTVDGIIGNQVSKRLYAYIRVKNAFNADAKGISTPFITGKPLEYIPQERRAISLGMTFSLN